MIYTVVTLLFLVTVGLGFLIRAMVQASNRQSEQRWVPLDEIMDGPSEL